MSKWASKAYLRLHGLLQGPPLKSQGFLKQHFKNFQMYVYVYGTNKKTNKELMSETKQKSISSECAHSVKL